MPSHFPDVFAGRAEVCGHAKGYDGRDMMTMTMIMIAMLIVAVLMMLAT